MMNHNCNNCNFRAKYDNNPKSLLGRLWRWHIKWCPGWKNHITSLSDKQKNELSQKYNLNI